MGREEDELWERGVILRGEVLAEVRSILPVEGSREDVSVFRELVHNLVRHELAGLLISVILPVHLPLL